MAVYSTVPTYEDFLKRAQESGQYDGLSEYDRQLSRKFPEYGMSLLNLKNDYAGATTDAQRLMSATAANQLRNSYGAQAGYSAPGDNAVTGTPGSDGTGSSFRWNRDADELWQAYRKHYLREGQRAAADTMAQAAAMTGGIPSSYAVTAASQAGDYYASQLTDKIPELYEQAYNRYMQEQQLERQKQQQEYDNAMSMYQTYGYVPEQYAGVLGMKAGTPTASQYYQDWYMQQQKQQQEEAAKQQEYENALKLYQTYGYVPQQYAGVLGLTAGTPSAEQLYQDWYRNFQEGNAGYSGGSSGGGSGGSYSSGGSSRSSSSGNTSGGYSGNGSLTTAQVKALQNALGVTADGLYGPQSRAAAGGLDAEAAYAKYVTGGSGSPQPGTAYNTAAKLALGAGPISDAMADKLLDDSFTIPKSAALEEQRKKEADKQKAYKIAKEKLKGISVT